jgi:subtilase family serine protease
LYRRDSTTFIAPAQTPHFSQPVPVSAAYDLVQVESIHRLMIPGVPTAFYRGYSPQQIARAFDFTGAYSAGYTGKNIDVAIVATGPMSGADTTMLSSIFNAKMAPIQQPPVTDSGVDTGLTAGGPTPVPSPGASPYPPYFQSSGLQSPPPVTPPCTDALPACNPEDDEAQIDTQAVASLAPDATALFYLAYNPDYCANLQQQQPAPCPTGDGRAAEGLRLWPAEVEQIIADDTADAVSISLGLPEAWGLTFYFNAQGEGFAPTAFATLAAEGISVFVASGDLGAYECFNANRCVWYPGSDPNVVSVGGVNAFIDSTGRLRGQITAWGDATTSGGNGSFENNIGSGGGVSTVFPAPQWQRTIQPFGQSGMLTMRAQPDVSLLADPATGAAIVRNAAFPGNQSLLPWGGTSLAAPQMAAMWALVLQACAQTASCATASGPHPYRLGNPAPLLYAIAASDTASTRVFYDVQAGDNSTVVPPTPAPLLPGYHAGPGYDLVTGLGVPFAKHLIDAVLEKTRR